MKNNIKINSLLVDGGMTANKTFCQLLSNTLQKNISKQDLNQNIYVIDFSGEIYKLILE